MSVMVAKARSMSASGARAASARFNLSEGSEILSGVQLPRAAGDALDAFASGVLRNWVAPAARRSWSRMTLLGYERPRRQARLVS